DSDATKIIKDEDVLDLTIISNFLHQIVNPLNGVSGTLDNVINGDVPASMVKKRLTSAKYQVENCIDLMRNLATFAEYTTNPVRYRQKHPGQDCSIPDMVIQAANFFQETARKRKMKIHLVDRETQYKIKADKDLLRQIFINLFDNAIKYGNEDSVV